MDIVQPYTPRNFGKEYCQINGSQQYPMFVAIALGMKPCFDDWVPVEKYDEFVNICKSYGLHVEPDVIFVKPNKEKDELIGGNNITTTFTVAKPFDKNAKEGDFHVFVAPSKEQAIETKKYGWYPCIINNRSINKPFVDHLRFGKNLGFPGCCIEFFKKYNNWSLYSHPHESFKNTPAIKEKAKGSYLCNNFLMDNTYFFIHHLPCAYRCRATIELARKIEEKISEVEPNFVKKTIEILKKSLLVFGERHFILFNGKMKNGAIDYFDCEYFTNPARPEEKIQFFDTIKDGNKIRLNGEKLIVLKNDEILNTFPRKKEWFLIDFD